MNIRFPRNVKRLEYIKLLRDYSRQDSQLLQKLSDEYYNTDIEPEAFIEKYKDYEPLAAAIVSLPSQKVKLTPCPFCGNNILALDYDFPSKLYWIDCCCCGPIKPSVPEAIRAWNIRV